MKDKRCLFALNFLELMKIMNLFFCLLFIVGISLTSCNDNDIKQANIQVNFLHKIGNQDFAQNTTTYSNALNESFTIKTLKYYVGELRLERADGSAWQQPTGSYALVDATESSSLAWPIANIAEGTYNKLSFLVGVDSLYNVSGAQSGALEPLNGMFWTWNSGYIFLKLEGKFSTNSDPILKNYTLHIGGFKGVNKAMRRITIDLSAKPLIVSKEKVSKLNLKTDVATMLNGGNTQISLANNPDVQSSSNISKQIADNYAQMFSLISVDN